MQSQAAVCTSEEGLFHLPNGKSISRGEGVGFEATAASVGWLRERGLFPPPQPDDDDDFVPEW